MKKAKFSKLLAKKMRRTILRSPLQFLTMVLILALASTLFSGLYASHLSFANRVDRLYEVSNLADIYTTTYLESDNPKQESEENLQIIKDAVGENGKVESKFRSMAKIHGLDAFTSLYDEYPTINLPWNLKNFNEDKIDFFIFNDCFISNPSSYGEKEEWIDENGDFVDQNIQIGIGGLKSLLNENNKELANILNEYKKTSDNILDSDFLTISIKPTGMMDHPENILPPVSLASTFVISRHYLAPKLITTIQQSYDMSALKAAIDKEVDVKKKANLERCYEILDNPKEEIMDQYWVDNYYLTRLNNREEADIYHKKIADTFSSKNKTLIENLTSSNTNTISQLRTDAMQGRQLCYVFPPVFFLVGILVVLTTISQIILKERGEIGTLKALGASNKSIFTYYLILSGIISLIGLAVGLIAGPLILPKILDFKYNMLYSVPSSIYIFPTSIAIIMVVLVLAVTSLVTYLVAKKEVRALPVESMHHKTIKIKSKGSFSKKKENNTHKLCSKMAIRNIFCAIPRSIMVVIGVFGCTGLLACGFGIDDSINKGINNDMNMFFQTDTMIYFSNPTTETLEKMTELYTNNVLTAVEPYAYLPSTCNPAGKIDVSFTANVYSLPKREERQFHFFNIGYEPSGNRIAITKKVAKNLNLKEGDIMSFSSLGNKYSGIVDKIVDTFFIHGVFIDGENPSYPMCKEYPTCAYARFNPDLNYDEVMNQVKKVPGVANVLNRSNLMESINSVASSISYITTTIKVFAILLAIVVLYNLALLNFNENIRNIATMKVLGFNRREVAESLFIEIMTLSIVGALIGLSIGYPLAYLTLSINQVPMCEYFYYIRTISLIVSLIIALGVASLVNIYLGLKTKKVKMVESLKSIE